MQKDEITKGVYEFNLEVNPDAKFQYPTTDWFLNKSKYQGQETLLTSGLIQVVGKTKTGAFLYDLTEKGFNEAMKCEEWLANNR